MKRTTLITTAAVWIGFAALGMAQDARHLTMEEASKAAVSKVNPDYPSIGRQLKLEGVVQVEASIDEKGAVDSVKVVSGNVVLANAAVAAVKRWKFAPLMADGKPTRGNASLSFTFKL